MLTRVFIEVRGVSPFYVDLHLTTLSNAQVGVIVRSAVLATDGLVLMLTWIKTYGIKRAATEAGLQASVSTLIMRDGDVIPS